VPFRASHSVSGAGVFLFLSRPVNLGFAALTMNADLKFSPTIFAWGAGIFFIGYFIFDGCRAIWPLEKFGASRCGSRRIMVTWGIISGDGAGVGCLELYTVRFLLASPRPDFFPGIFLSDLWYQRNIATRFLASFAIAVRSPP